jgi:hypothetical protein
VLTRNRLGALALLADGVFRLFHHIKYCKTVAGSRASTAISYAQLDIRLAKVEAAQAVGQATQTLSDDQPHQEGQLRLLPDDQRTAVLLALLPQRPHLHLRAQSGQHRHDQRMPSVAQGSTVLTKGVYYPTYYLPAGLYQYLYYRFLERTPYIRLEEITVSDPQRLLTIPVHDSYTNVSSC